MNHDELERWFMDNYTTTVDRVFRFCLVRVRDREAAQDITHDTFARMWEYVAGGNEIAHFQAFAYKTARNAIVDHAKKAKPVYEHELGDKAEAVLEAAVDGNAELLAELDALLKCMEGLSDEDHDLVIMRYTEGFPINEIAAAYDMKPNTLTVRLTRALESLRRCIGIPSAKTV